MQDDWVDHLPMAKFAANNHVNVSTKISLFFADNEFHPRVSVELLWTHQGAGRRAELFAADKIVANQKQIATFLQDQLIWAQQE